MTSMLRSIAIPPLPRLGLRPLSLSSTVTVPRRLASSSSASTAKRTSKVLSTSPKQPSGPVIIYTATRATRPRLFLAAGATAAVFFANAAFAVYDLLKVTVPVPTSQLDPSKSPTSVAGRIPQFIRKGTPLPADVQSHLDANPPSPLRAWIAASACVAVGAVCVSFTWRFARSWVHSIALVYPTAAAASKSASAAPVVMAEVTYGTLPKVVKRVPVTQVYTIRPVADMVRSDRPFIYIKKDAGSKMPVTDTHAHNQSLMLTMDSQGDFTRNGAVFAVDRLFMQNKPIQSSSPPTVL